MKIQKNDETFPLFFKVTIRFMVILQNRRHKSLLLLDLSYFGSVETKPLKLSNVLRCVTKCYIQIFLSSGNRLNN